MKSKESIDDTIYLLYFNLCWSFLFLVQLFWVVNVRIHILVFFLLHRCFFDDVFTSIVTIRIIGFSVLLVVQVVDYLIILHHIGTCLYKKVGSSYL